MGILKNQATDRQGDNLEFLIEDFQNRVKLLFIVKLIAYTPK